LGLTGEVLMSKAQLEGITLNYEENGSGFPLIFCHEFGQNAEGWEHQVKFFSKYYRVITYSARGYPPSAIPDNLQAYSQDIVVADLYHLITHLGIDQAYICGLSMGGSVALNFGLKYPDISKALIIAGTGSGSTNPDDFKQETARFAAKLREQGMNALKNYSVGPVRMQFKNKHPDRWKLFQQRLYANSPIGSSYTLEGFIGSRPSIFSLKESLQKMLCPTLIIIGDEDEPCVEPALFLKRTIPMAGLAVLPQTGHTLNVEEPEKFNNLILDFLQAVENQTWLSQGPRLKSGFLSNED